MIVDTSALVAVVFEEPEAKQISRAIRDADVVRVGAPTLVEATAVVLGRPGPRGEAELRALLAAGRVETVAMSPRAAEIACAAYARYGKGVGNPGVLNFGDCLAYGVAQAFGEPLLFKGNDFAATDVRAAPY